VAWLLAAKEWTLAEIPILQLLQPLTET
jgi:hypothetical protein